MNALRALAFLFLTLGMSASLAVRAASPASGSGGYVDGAMFRALVDDTKDIVEVNLDGAILQALAAFGGSDSDPSHTKEVFGKLKAIHAVIGTIKGASGPALALVQKTDQALVAKGWQRITRISNPNSTITVLTHTVGDRVDGLVALSFDGTDNELVFANLAGEIDVTQLGEIGKRFNVPALDHLPEGH
jgi:hypothetical protein